MRIILISFLTLSFQVALGAQMTKNTNLLAIGQGISSPTSTSTVNFTSGYTPENPLGTTYQNGFRATLEYDENGSKTTGGELGFGNGDWGIAIGHAKGDCKNCKGRTAGAAGVNVSRFGLGIRYEKDVTAIGLLINPNETHRFGVVFNTDERAGSGLGIKTYGVGYSYVGADLTFTIDASQNEFENKTVKDDRVLVTPGIMLRASHFQLSINDRITLNKDKNNALHNKDEDHELWFGLGLGGETFHLAAYSNYVNDIAFAGSFFF